MDGAELEQQIDCLEAEVELAEDGKGSWRQVWTSIKAITANFKGARFTTRDTRNDAWSRFQEIVARVKHGQAERRRHQDDQVANLESKLEELTDAVRNAQYGHIQYKEVWELIREIGTQFKAARLPREQQQTAWRTFQGLIDTVKSTQTARHQEQQGRAERSEELRKEIARMAESARPSGSGGLLFALVEGAASLATAGAFDSETDDRQNELRRGSSDLKSAWDLFNENKTEMLGRDKHITFELLRSVQAELDTAWEEWKESKAAARSARQREREEKHQAWVIKTRDRIASNEEKLTRLYDVLSRKENHLADLNQKRDDAWSDAFRERIESWISEEEESITDIRSKIQRVEGWVEEDRNKLDDD